MATTRASKRTEPDVAISGGGTVYLFHLITPLAQAWVDEHVNADRQMFGDAVAVEHRYAAALAVGMQRDGLVLGDQEDI